jgi:hypothetical protein
MTFKLISALAGTTTAFMAGRSYVRKNYPPTAGVKETDQTFVNHQGRQFTVLDSRTVVDEKGMRFTRLGWTGHHREKLEGDLTQKELYYGSKQIAQEYAKINAGAHFPEHQAVGLIGVPEEKAHLLVDGLSRFDNGFVPLAPKGMQDAGLTVLHIEEVTKQSDLSTMAAVKRMLDQ